MNEEKVAISRQTFRRLLGGIANFLRSPVGGKARLMLVALLFLIAVVYALVGSTLAGWLGRPLIRLNYRQSDFEANFRAELIHTREEGGKILATGKESGVKERLNSHIDGLVSTLRHIMSVNRNLSFFTSGYNYLIQLIPVLIVAPLFIQRQIEFGVIGQSAMAFATLLGAFSRVITQF